MIDNNHVITGTEEGKIILI